jgi:hypothetical protein
MRPAPRQCPPVLVRRLTDQEYPAVAEHRPTHAQLRRRVSVLLPEYHLDVPHIQTGMLGHDPRRQGTKLLVTFPVVLVARKGKARLRQCLHFASP